MWRKGQTIYLINSKSTGIKSIVKSKIIVKSTYLRVSAAYLRVSAATGDITLSQLSTLLKKCDWFKRKYNCFDDYFFK